MVGSESPACLAVWQPALWLQSEACERGCQKWEAAVWRLDSQQAASDVVSWS